MVIGNHDGKSASDRIGGRALRRMRTHLGLRLCAAEMTALVGLRVHKGYAPTSGPGSHQVSPVAHMTRGMDMAATRDRATGHAPHVSKPYAGRVRTRSLVRLGFRRVRLQTLVR